MPEVVKRLITLYCDERISKDMKRLIRSLEAEKRQEPRRQMLEKLQESKERQMELVER